jgi:YidC/Oxa1 family membrane protein insertase
MGADQRRAILAVVLSGIVLFGWQYFMGPTTDQSTELKTTVTQNNTTTSTTKTETQPSTQKIESTTTTNPVATVTTSKEFVLKAGKDTYVVNNNLTLLDATYSNTTESLTNIFKDKQPNSILFNVNGVFQKIFFSFEQLNDREIKVYNKDLNIVGNISINEKGLLLYALTSDKNFQYTLQWNGKEEMLENGQTKQFVYYSKELETYAIGDDDKGDRVISWSGIDFNYHLLAAVFPDKQNYLYDIAENGTFSLKSNTPTNKLNLKYIFTKKEYDHMIGLGDNLDMSVDFGIWSIIAVPILRGLQFFFSVFPNYGISIILLTLIIRMLTFPLQYKSFKSMKKMQDIQPELTKVREKFKDNPQKMQQETMALFKRAGANPLSGCLPLLLQMPIFFAFYKVLYSAVELVDAPFYLWISDLSEKDPYYVLPVLMALAMFLQQKLTPSTTADPVQKKVMLFMPLLFAVFMKDLPAGLTLYIFVSTLVGMAQQLLVFKRA